MIRASTAIAATVICASTLAQQQTSPFGSDNRSILEIQDPDGSRKKDFLKGVLLIKDGFYVRRAQNDYHLIFDRLIHNKNSVRSTDPPSGQSCSLSRDFQPIGLLKEQQNKTTFFFKGPQNFRVMLSRTDLSMPGVTVEFPAYLVSEEIGGKKLVSALSVPLEKSNMSVWKSIWLEKKVLYEYYSETTLIGPSEPTFSHKFLVESINSIHCTKR